mgnify:CR=1 FL=1
MPEVVQQKPPEINGTPLNDALFADMGDTEAAKQGVSWDGDGNLVYKDK